MSPSLIIFVSLSCLSLSSYAQVLDFSGQVSGWVTMKPDDAQLGMRYIPELSFKKQLSKTYEISAEAAVNARWFSQFDNWRNAEHIVSMDAYRLWARFASSQYEARVGLQKISFGSATLLRPLRWFDSIDPRDPLQITEGVYSLLGRYYFPNNANIWLWALDGNDNLKGWESLPTDKWRIEWGGRVQIPVNAGELGFAYDRRRVNPNGSLLQITYPKLDTFLEDHFGLDGKWDVGAGLWFESSLTRRGFDVPESRYQRYLTVGIDYTFDIGNGPHVLFEQFRQDQAKTLLGTGNGAWISALSIDYPLGILDKVMTIVYYDWRNNDWSRLLQWQRSYDQWQMNVSAFWNPEQLSLAQNNVATGSFAGYGVQFMLVFNH